MQDTGLLHGVCHVPSAYGVLHDAAKAQRYYISNCLKKPNRVPIRQFVQGVQQLKDYLELSPCLYQSNRATPATKKVGPIDDADLAGHI